MDGRLEEWEYIEARITDGSIVKVNGQQVGKVGLFGSSGASIHEFLNKMGNEGWELVAIPVGVSGHGWLYMKHPVR